MGHTSVRSTLPLAKTAVPPFSAGFGVFADASPRVDRHGLLNDQPILDELPDVLPGVGVGDFVDLVGV